MKICQEVRIELIKNQKIKQGLRLTKAEAVRRRTEAQAAKYAETFIIWTPEQDQFLRENYPKFTAKEMSQKMSRSHASIKGRVAKLKNHTAEKNSPETPGSQSLPNRPARLEQRHQRPAFQSGHRIQKGLPPGKHPARRRPFSSH